MADLGQHPNQIGELVGHLSHDLLGCIVALVYFVRLEQLLGEAESPASEGVHGVVGEVVGGGPAVRLVSRYR